MNLGSVKKGFKNGFNLTPIKMNRPLKNTRVVHSTCSMRSSKCVMSANKMSSMAPSIAIHPDKKKTPENDVQ